MSRPSWTPIERVCYEFGFGDGVVNAGDEDAEAMAAEIVLLRAALGEVLVLADRGEAWSLHTRQQVRDTCNEALAHVDQGAEQ